MGGVIATGGLNVGMWGVVEVSKEVLESSLGWVTN
jgi:hypothetical protein